MLKQYLQRENPSLGNLSVALQQIRELNRVIAACLPGETSLLRHCIATRSINNTLTIIAENPHWATRMRFLAPQLLKALRTHQGYESLKSVCCKSVPAYTPATSHPFARRKLEISTETGVLLQETASRIKDEKICNALKKLSARAKTGR